MEAPDPSRNRSRLTWLAWLFTSKPARAYPLVYVVGRVALANVAPVVVFPSAAKEPDRTSVDSTTRPPLVVHPDRSPVSKPSPKTGTGGAVVVAVATADRSETFPARSVARTW